MSYDRSIFPNIARLKSEFPNVDVDRTVSKLLERMNQPNAEPVNSPGGLLASWVKRDAERAGVSQVANEAEYGQFRVKLLQDVFARILTPKGAAAVLLSAKLGRFGDLIRDEEIRHLQALGDDWSAALGRPA